jgi:uncharacterized membrane protein
MLLVLPIYALFPSPYTLFFLQALAGGAGAIVIFLLAKHLLRSELAATSLSLAYLLHPSLQRANLNLFQLGFHPDNFFPPLLLYSLYSLEKGRRYLATFFWLLALAVDERWAILLATLGLYLLLVKRERRFGTIMTALSILWFIAATKVIMPHFLRGQAPYYLLSFDQLLELRNLGLGNLASALIRYLLFLIGPLLLLPLADLPSLFIIMPMLLTFLAALSIQYHFPMNPASWHVNALLPIAFLSAILGMRRVMNLVKQPLKQHRLITLGPILVLLTTAFSTYWLGSLPFSRSIHPLRYAVDEEVAQSVKEVRALVPHEASLAASRYIGSNFTQQQTILLLLLRTRSSRQGTVARVMWRRAEYILIDINQHLRRGRLRTDRFDKGLLDLLLESEEYEVLYSDNNIWLFKKIAPTSYSRRG